VGIGILRSGLFHKTVTVDACAAAIVNVEFNIDDQKQKNSRASRNTWSDCNDWASAPGDRIFPQESRALKSYATGQARQGNFRNRKTTFRLLPRKSLPLFIASKSSRAIPDNAILWYGA
jgi:hypothetical protein